jgi:hypothetical protein
MGDRTWVKIFVKEKDITHVENIFGESYTSSYHFMPNVLELYYDEVNWGGIEELEELASCGVNFIANWGTGDDYPPGICVSFCKIASFVHKTANGDYYIPVTIKDGIVTADQEDLKRLKPHAVLKFLVEAYLYKYKLPEKLYAVFAKARLGGSINDDIAQYEPD